jgi:acetyl-CoA carboxylase biotin carboxylase subunit
MVPPFYDSMIAKLIVRGSSRAEAVDRIQQALARFEVGGIATNIPLLRAIVAHDDFRSNRVSTRWLETTLLPSFTT